MLLFNSSFLTQDFIRYLGVEKGYSNGVTPFFFPHTKRHLIQHDKSTSHLPVHHTHRAHIPGIKHCTWEENKAVCIH